MATPTPAKTVRLTSSTNVDCGTSAVKNQLMGIEAIIASPPQLVVTSAANSVLAADSRALTPAEILQKAKEMDLPLMKENLLITRRGPSFTLEWEYHWPIDLKVYHHELTFHNSETGELFENAPN